ncbi:MAG: DUF1697 domain-containing protein [Spirosomaceae bacterium]|nr:DUF1697 domain-containing protein [Spirosomataceae bacterium]
MNSKTTLIAFLRGINVGGRHKVPMPELRKTLIGMGFENIRTLLNSGNVVFDTAREDTWAIEEEIENHLSGVFAFPIPVIVCPKTALVDLVAANPFANQVVNENTRLYVSFLKSPPLFSLTTPWFSKDKTYQILSVDDKIICSVLDLSSTQTSKGMDELEKLFGKAITTRNWNTVLKVIEM